MRRRCLFLVGFLITVVSLPLSAQPRRERLERPTPGTHLSPTQTQNVQKLQADLVAIQATSDITAAMRADLAASLMAVVQGAQKPGQAAVMQLATDLSQALADSTLSPQEQRQLAQDLQAVLNSAAIPPAEAEAAIQSIKAVLLASHVTPSDVQTIMQDLQAIKREAQQQLQRPLRKRR